MIFGKHINKYYLKYAHLMILGLAALVMVDYMQLIIPNLYQMVINGMNQGFVMVDGVRAEFTMDFLLDKICMPMVGVILCMVVGRFLWRIALFGAAIKLEADLRDRMFDRCKDLSREYYQINKVGNLTVILPHFSAAWADFNVNHNLWEMLHTCSKFRKLFA